MFLGEYQHTLDAKGRVSLPAKFRAEMTGKLVVAQGLDDCLYVYPADQYGEFVAKLLEKEDFDPSLRRLRRFFTAGAQEVELDSAGRISLPANLRDYAHLTKEVVVQCNGNRIEIWDVKTRDAYESEAGVAIDDLAKELAAAGQI